MTLKTRLLRIILMPLLWRYIYMPGKNYNGPVPELNDRQREIKGNVERTVRALAGDLGERNIRRIDNLHAAEQLIADAFEMHGWSVTKQTFNELGVETSNIIAERKGAKHPDEIIVVGAHYDSVWDMNPDDDPALPCPGADDNASAVAAMLECARLLCDRVDGRTLRLVAFANEECLDRHPGAKQWTDIAFNMGSGHYAQSCKDNGDNIVGMISLEMLGYYLDTPGSQNYPKPMNLLSSNVGNFLGFVGDSKSRSFITRSIKAFRRHGKIPTMGIAAPNLKILRDVNRSDHFWFMHLGYKAFMLTDTANFRNPHYHKSTDTADTLDYHRLALATDAVIEMVSHLVNR